MRGRGYGQAVIEAGVILVREAGSATLWCNARTSALGFYRRMGFETRGQEFLTANGIPHFVAVRALP
jgi:predicted GNAT family N-acyltransferase